MARSRLDIRLGIQFHNRYLLSDQQNQQMGTGPIATEGQSANLDPSYCSIAFVTYRKQLPYRSSTS